MSEIKIKSLVLGPVSTNCYIVCNDQEKKCIIIDPADQAAAIIKTVESLNMTPEAILLTHGHFDHIGAAAEVKQHFGIKIYANELEKEVLTSSYNNLSNMMGGNPFILEADYNVRDGEKFEIAGFHIQAISTPGHTQGGMCYLVATDKERALFSGDTIFAGSVGRYDFPTSSGTTLFASIKKKLLQFEDDLAVYPGHGEETTIGDERPAF